MISGSRAGFAATIVGVMALLFLMMRERLKTRDQLGRALFVGVAVALAIGLLAGGQMIRKISYFQQSDTADRVIIWRTAAKAIGDSPWWGWGLGSFADIYAVYQPKEIIQPNDKAHSTPLETVVELGIPGAIPAWLVVLIPWALCLRGAWRSRRRHRYLPAAAFAVSSVAILHSTIDFSLQMPAIGFVVSAFLGMGWAQAFSRSVPPPWAFTSERE
jgi:O-antigen ligase